MLVSRRVHVFQLSGILLPINFHLFGSARNSRKIGCVNNREVFFLQISPDGFGISNILLAVHFFLREKNTTLGYMGLWKAIVHAPAFNPGWKPTDHRITPGEPLDLVIENRIPLDLPPPVSMMPRWQDSFHFEYREFLLKFPASWYRWSRSLCFILAANVFKSPKTVTPQHRNTTQGTPRPGELSFQPVHGKTRYSNSSRF